MCFANKARVTLMAIAFAGMIATPASISHAAHMPEPSLTDQLINPEQSLSNFELLPVVKARFGRNFGGFRCRFGGRYYRDVP